MLVPTRPLDLPRSIYALKPYEQSKLDDLQLQQVGYYLDRVNDEGFEWRGPVSNKVSRPADPALQALVCIGDPAVPGLLQLAESGYERPTQVQICDALAEIGLPVALYYDELMAGQTDGLGLWWLYDGKPSLAKRTTIRNAKGLPPPNLYDADGQRMVVE